MPMLLEGPSVLEAPRVRPSIRSPRLRPHPAHPEVQAEDVVVSVSVETRRSWFDTLEPPKPGDWDALGLGSGDWLDR